MAMELLALSKFKLQLLALIAQIRDVREGERAVREELQLSIQRREQIEAEYTKRLQDLQAQIVSLEESHCRLDSKTTLLVKDELIQRLTMEKQKLHLQLGKMEVVLRKIQDPVLKLIPQDQEMSLPALGSQETRDMINTDRHIACGSPATASSDVPMIDNPYKDPDAASVHHHVGMNSTTDAGD